MTDNYPPGVTRDEIDREDGVPRKLLWPAIYSTLDEDEQDEWDEEMQEWQDAECP